MAHLRAVLAAALLWAVCTSVQAQHPEASHTRFTGFIFGDVTFAASERDGTHGFLLGQLVGHGNALLTERLSFFGELSATARESSYAFEVERAIMQAPRPDQGPMTRRPRLAIAIVTAVLLVTAACAGSGAALKTSVHCRRASGPPSRISLPPRLSGATRPKRSAQAMSARSSAGHRPRGRVPLPVLLLTLRALSLRNGGTLAASTSHHN